MKGEFYLFCPGCGKDIAYEDSNLACECGYDPASEAPTQAPGPAGPTGSAASDFVGSLTSRFSINQLVIFGGCALLLISMFFPFMSVANPLAGILGGRTLSSTSGFSLVFNCFGYFLDLLLPLLAVAGLSAATALSVVKLDNAKFIVMILAFAGAYMSLSSLFHIRSFAGFGLVIFFILWLIVAAAAFMEYKGIQLVKF